jgi:hypothetical protein
MSGPVDVCGVIRTLASIVRTDNGNLHKEINELLDEADTAVEAFSEVLIALDDIVGLSRALRVGGPDPMDLQGLSDALSEAVDTAHAALEAVGGAK